MIYNINTVITTAPKIPRKLDTVKAALLLGVVVSCPPSGVVVPCPPAGVVVPCPPAGVVVCDAVIVCD
jgi:hypothetical protein